METSHERLKNSICCALFAALTAVGAFIRIPFGVISFTLQTFFVVLSGALLGKKYGTMAQALYVILGLIGIPIFTKGGGPQYVLEPSFGYLLGVLSYRGGRKITVLLAVGVPVLFFGGLPAFLIGTSGNPFLARVIQFLFGSYSSTLATLLVLTVMFHGIGGLLQNRAQVRTV